MGFVDHVTAPKSHVFIAGNRSLGAIHIRPLLLISISFDITTYPRYIKTKLIEIERERGGIAATDTYSDESIGIFMAKGSLRGDLGH